ncbi:hypothetical protein [uncultured Methanobrevibacter sp.]|uniref:hypothetical protein n=1 Tax=uncultured Methanobrevibacter sp. TaxID=253161 RepID=UPI0025DAA7AE|nr:hypothetical protein [uncultured Methanobrevibacter sp.]
MKIYLEHHLLKIIDPILELGYFANLPKNLIPQLGKNEISNILPKSAIMKKDFT